VKSWIRRETVIRQRPVFVKDSYGNTIADWTDPGELPIDGCLFAPGAGQEVLTNRDGVQLAGVVYAPPASDVTATDAVTVRGTPIPGRRGAAAVARGDRHQRRTVERLTWHAPSS
jgi:hypothetical protein